MSASVKQVRILKLRGYTYWQLGRHYGRRYASRGGVLTANLYNLALLKYAPPSAGAFLQKIKQHDIVNNKKIYEGIQKVIGE